MTRIVPMPGPFTTALGAAARLVTWLVFGPFSGLIPLLLLYGVFEFGLDFLSSRSRRQRRLDITMVSNCALGVIVWLIKSRISLILLGLLGLLALSTIATVVALILSMRGKGRRKKRRRATAGEAASASPGTELAQS